MQTSLNNGMCRCCASEGTFKNFTNTYHWMGEEEVYADMLKECFDISLTTSDPGEEGGICEVCITQLRNAANFKKQVLNTEQQFQRRLQDKLFKTELVKVEETCLDEAADDNSDNDNNISEDFSGPEYDLQIKAESPEEAKPKKRTAKATTSRAKKTKIDDGEPSTKRYGRAATRDAVDISGINKIRFIGKKIFKTKKDVESENKEVAKQRNNIRNILKYSNATPIRRCGDIGYTCSFCENQYKDPAELKNHTLKDHDEATKEQFMMDKSLYSFLVKLDITTLQCTICSTIVDNLDVLIDHLIKHGIKMFKDIKNHILPFKLGDTIFKCVICHNVYSKFKVLQEHMYIHYRNYICNICGAGFVNQSMIACHSLSHKIGIFNCDYCTKVYDTLRKKQSHERSVHLKLLYKCGHCNEKFKNYYKKSVHLATVHGVRTPSVECKACGKCFSKKYLLTVHIKKDHLMERRYECEQCDMKFFTGYALRQHMTRHSDLKEFQCGLCSKTFGRKKSLREHIRIHVGDRRFKCVHCGLTFVQKCSLTGHLRSKHGEYV